MSRVLIQTPQNVPIEFEAASIGERIQARLLDLLIMVLYSVPLNLFLATIDQDPNPVLVVVLNLPVALYSVLFETLLDGQTPGKRVLNIRVVRLDGTQPGLGSYLIRWLFWRFEGVLTGYSLAITAIATSLRGQRLGDRAAGTAVVKKHPGKLFEASILRVLKDSYQPLIPQAEWLTDHDMAIVDKAYARSLATRDRRLMKTLSDRLLLVLSLDRADPRLKGFTPLKFVNQVITDYNYFSGRV